MLRLRVAAGPEKPEAARLQALEFQLQNIEAVLRVKMRQRARDSAYTTLTTSSRSRAINQCIGVEQLRSDTGVSHAGRPVPGIVDDMILNGQFERG